MSWVNPTGHEDPEDEWLSEESAYDDVPMSGSDDLNVPTGTWSAPIILKRSAIYSLKIRFLGECGPEDFDAVEIYVYDVNASEWIFVYEGDFNAGYAAEWNEIDLDQLRLINKVRFRFYNGFFTPMTAILYEADFWNVYWISPVDYIDTSGNWEDEPKCYDDHTGTFAYNLWGNEGFGGVLGLLLASAIPCDKIRFWYGTTGDAQIKVEVKRDGVWFTVFEGAAPENEWVEKSFVQGQVEAAKVNISSTGIIPPKRWLYEFDFWEVPPPLPAWRPAQAKSDYKRGQAKGYVA